MPDPNGLGTEGNSTDYMEKSFGGWTRGGVWGDDPLNYSSTGFICIGDQPELDFGGRRSPDGQGFAAFGRVVEGRDVVRRIQQSPADGQRLTPPILIRRAIRTR